GKVYELSGDTSWDHVELASTVADLIGREVTYRPVTPEEHRTILTDAGVPLPQAEFVVALDGNTRDGLLAGTNGELSALIGRATTPLRDGLAEARVPAEA
ncbi:MAG TPA: hypothetical protein VL179_10995, partial [Mycobacterium sp.]|nr:hypothetical protein [Mycobacterium sp.]